MTDIISFNNTSYMNLLKIETYMLNEYFKYKGCNSNTDKFVSLYKPYLIKFDLFSLYKTLTDDTYENINNPIFNLIQRFDTRIKSFI